MIQTTLRMSDNQAAYVRGVADRSGVSMNTAVLALIDRARAQGVGSVLVSYQATAGESGGKPDLPPPDGEETAGQAGGKSNLPPIRAGE